MDRCSIDTVSGARRNLNRVEPKASGSLWISPAKKQILFYLHSIRVQDSFFIFLNIKYYIHMYCDFINIHWKQIFKDFVLKFSHEIKCSLKKNVWQQFFIKSIKKTNPQNWISLRAQILMTTRITETMMFKKVTSNW